MVCLVPFFDGVAFHDHEAPFSVWLAIHAKRRVDCEKHASAFEMHSYLLFVCLLPRLQFQLAYDSHHSLVLVHLCAAAAAAQMHQNQREMFITLDKGDVHNP